MSSISDRYVIFHIAGNAQFQPSVGNHKTLKRDMRHRNIKKFVHKMKIVNWNQVLECDDALLACTTFHAMISEKYNKCFPLRKFSSNLYTNNNPWLTPALNESIKMKNKLYINRNRGDNKEEKLAFYKHNRNKLNHILRITERKYYQDLLTKHQSNVKKSWQVIKTIINKRKYKPINTKFKCNETITEDGQVISNKFNNFFVNVGATLAKNIPITTKSPVECIITNNTEHFVFDPVSENEVLRIIGNFKDSSAVWDELKPLVMKNIKESIKTPLTHICNKSFSSGLFPSELKIANVIPIFKSGDEMVFSNYRPVSVLPVFSKLLERLMYNRLICFINENKLLYDYQFDFQKGKSTYMAMVMLVEKISEALDRGECVIGVFLDFSKAFDTVDHKIVLQKLEIYGVNGASLKWFESYLSERTQYVTYNSVKSARERVNCGVPPGSILGPLLFLLYINDLSSVSEYCYSVLFADDTNVFISGENVNVLCSRLNDELEGIREWLCCNKLSLNVSKTHYMSFTPRNKIVPDIDVKIHGVSVERVYATKFLGVIIDSKLTWKPHIEYICKKLSKCVGTIAKVRRKLHRLSLITLYYSFAYPYFIYCNHVWGNNYASTLEKIKIIQKRPIRTISCSPYRAHTAPLFYANRLLTISDINTYTIGAFMYRFLNGNLPDIFEGFFVKNRDRNVHQYNVRNADELYVPYARLDVRNFSLKIAGAKLWNVLPNHIKESSSIDILKQNLKII